MERTFTVHVLDDMSEQQGIITAWDPVRRVAEFRDCISPQSLCPSDGHRVWIMVDAHRALAKVLEVSADSASDVQGPAKPKPAEVPPIWRLYVDKAFPPYGTKSDQTVCIVGADGPLALCSNLSRCATHDTLSALVA